MEYYREVAYFNIYSMRNEENYKKWQKEYKEKNKDKIKEYMKEYRKTKEYKEKKKIQDKEYYEKNKEKLIQKSIEQNKKEIRKQWLEENKEYLLEKSKEYKEKNKGKIKEQTKKYREENRDSINEKRRNRMDSDPLYRLSTNIRNLIKYYIKNNGYTKKSKTIDILGCTYEEFRLHLESKFEPWMTWENYGKYNGELNYGWDVDHIIPISSSKEEIGIINLNHYTNLQPLCSYTNRVLKRTNDNYL